MEKLRDRIKKDIDKMTIEINNLNKRLSNKNFVEKAPLEVVEDCKNNLEEAKTKFEIHTKKLDILS